MITNLFVRRTVFLLCTVMALDMSCSNNESGEKKDCSDSDLAIDATPTHPTTCSSTDGEIEVEATGGKAPYKYSINGGAFVDDAIFDGLSSGSFTVTIKDAENCTRDTEITLTNPSSTLEVAIASSEDTGCKTSVGSLNAEATGGTGPYTYKLNNGAFGESAQFTALAAGTYTITAKDANGCTSTSVATHITTGVSYEADIKPLIANRCVHCHGPNGVWAGTTRDWTVFANVKNFAAAIKSKTADGSMPKDLAGSGGLPQAERDLIACWVDDGALNN
jgi:hypothetical protein